MKTCSSLCALLLSFLFLGSTHLSAQQAGKFEIKKITPSVISTPEYSYTGDKRRSELGKWLEVEVEFSSSAEVTEEATFKYYISINGSLLVGEVTHVNIPSGNGFSVMYIAPGTLTRAMKGKGFNATSIDNIGVEIVRQGAVLTSSSLKNARPMWWQQMPQVPNFVLNKNQTPFAPLYWDRYPEIRTQSR